MATNGKVARKRIDGDIVTFTFANGKVLACDVSTLATDIYARAVAHGIAQKVGDAFANSKELGGSDPVEWAYRRACEVWAILTDAEAPRWNDERESSDGNLPAALARVTGRPLADCIAAVAKLDDEKKKALRATPKVKIALAEMAVERAKTKSAQAADDLDESIFA